MPSRLMPLSAQGNVRIAPGAQALNQRRCRFASLQPQFALTAP